MPLDEDKYPSETGRRRFVKGVVGSAALASVGTGGAAAIDTVTQPSGIGGGVTQFVGVENTDGPAPRGMPIVPITIDSEGAIKGVFPETKQVERQGQTITVAEQDIGGVTYSSTWFQYCGVQNYEGIQPEPEADVTNFLRAAAGPPSGLSWQGDAKEAGDKMFVEDFDDYEKWGNGIGRSGYGKPAITNWRSDADEVSNIPVQVVRSPEVSKVINGEGRYSDVPDQVRSFYEAATENDFIAWMNKCTHFCCVPGFKAYEGSTQFGGSDRVYCQCHQSIYDPFSPVSKSFVALPRPEE